MCSFSSIFIGFFNIIITLFFSPKWKKNVSLGICSIYKKVRKMIVIYLSLLIIFIFIKFNEKGGGTEKIHYVSKHYFY